ncbi:MAG: NAD(P)-dependent oxidoreductase [Chloroflexota bacterium]
MRLLVTGAGGFVCRSIIAELVFHPAYEIIALDRAFDAELVQRWAGKVEMITGNVDAETLSDIEFDAYIHGAALTASAQESGMTPIANLRANLDPVLAIIEAAGPDKRGILISSDAAFRETRGPIDDSVVPVPLGLYATAKRTIESLVDTLRTLHGYNLTVIRFGNVFGPEEKVRDTRPRISRVGRYISEALTTGTIMVDAPDETHGWTFAPDIGRAVHTMLHETWNHPLYNVASGEVMTNIEAAEVVKQVVPGTQITAVNEPSPPHPRQGHLVSDCLCDDIGFDTWTPFAEGVAQIIRASQTEQPS